jgi:RNA polymerase sigma-70 factor (ECF subfamily)
VHSSGPRPSPDQHALPSPPGEEETALLLRVAGGEQAAFAALYDTYATRAFSLAHRICRSRWLAEEVTQDAFWYLWQRPTAFDPARGRFAPWFLALVHHRSVDALRRDLAQRRHAGLLATDPAGTGDCEQEALTRLAGAELQSALRCLPAGHRRVLALQYFGGYTQSEVAAATGLALGTVKSRTHTALRQLRTHLATPAPAHPAP